MTVSMGSYVIFSFVGSLVGSTDASLGQSPWHKWSEAEIFHMLLGVDFLVWCIWTQVQWLVFFAKT